ncbi:MAG: ABC transporter permease [Candidatus Helarchaeota archaeon]
MKNRLTFVIILKMDIKNFFRFTYWIAILMVSYIIDLLIMANTLGNLIVGLNYLKFFSPGITLVSAFSASFILGRKINIEKENKFDFYLLSLPLKRLDFILGRALAGALQGLVYSFPLLITSFILIRLPNILEILIILFFIIVFSLSMTSLAIILATSIRGSRNFTLARSLVYLWLMFGSTIFYPIDIISNYFPNLVVYILQFNPMSFGVNILRSLLFQWQIQIQDMIGITIFTISIIFLGIFAYDRSVNK